MAGKRRNPCYRCGGGRIIEQFKHVDAGICFRCDGSGIDPGRSAGSASRAVSSSGKRTLDAAERRRIAKESLAQVKRFIELMEDTSQWNYALVSADDGYDVLAEEMGKHLAWVILDSADLLNRAADRARARIPDDYKETFEYMLARTIFMLSKEYAGIVWDGR